MTVLSNAQIVTPTEIVKGSLAIQGDTIAHIDPSASQQGIDCEGDYLLPGLIELHTDNAEHHFMPRPKVYWPNPLAAVLAHDREIIGAGITTVFDAFSVGDYDGAASPRRTLFATMVNAVEQGNQLGVFKAEHLLHFRCEISDPRLMDVLEPIAERRDLRLVSVMDHTPGQRQWRDLDALKTFMGRTNLSPDAIEAAIQSRMEQGSRYVPGNWRKVLDLFAGRGLTLATHDDTTVKDIDMAVAEGITISEFPCSLEAAQAAHRHGMTTIGGAPNVVRGGSHSGNVSIIDLAKGGLLDALSSDYAPSSLLQAAFVLAEQLEKPLVETIKTVTSAPAAMVGLADRGRLEPNLRADIIRVRWIEKTPVVMAVYRAGQQVG